MAAHTTTHCDDPNVSLAVAMVCASATPLLLLDGDCTVMACSVSFCEAFQVDPAAAASRSFFELGHGQWATPQLRSLMSATLSGDAQIDAYEAELQAASGPRTVVLNVRRLSYEDTENVRLLVAVSDVTAARALEKAGRELEHDNLVLSQEIRHRVANSLQIIASVMMLNARRTSSEELRGHLRDAQNRLLSIASLQRQLAVASGESVDVHAYLSKLCNTIGASMIPDPTELVLSVDAPSVQVDADVSVSLGLVVTELVINALKHGFPEGASGEIVVGYQQTGAGWTLSVSDTGVGMPKKKGAKMPGLGTSIVQALARQLRADVVVTGASPGTRVALVHDPARVIDFAPPSGAEVPLGA